MQVNDEDAHRIFLFQGVPLLLQCLCVGGLQLGFLSRMVILELRHVGLSRLQRLCLLRLLRLCSLQCLCKLRLLSLQLRKTSGVVIGSCNNLTWQGGFPRAR